MCLFDSFSKAFASPAYIRKVCVRLHSENSEPTSFSQMTPDEHPPTPPPCRWPTLITTHPHQISARWALPVMLCCSAPSASSSAPLRPSVRYPTTGLVVNTMHIRTFCDHINVLHIFGQICIVLKSGWSSTTTRMLASWLVFLCLRLTPRRHRQADGQPSPFYPPSPSFKSFGAACVKLCCLPPPSLAKNIHICSLV